MNSYAIYRMVPLSMTLSDLWRRRARLSAAAELLVLLVYGKIKCCCWWWLRWQCMVPWCDTDKHASAHLRLLSNHNSTVHALLNFCLRSKRSWTCNHSLTDSLTGPLDRHSLHRVVAPSTSSDYWLCSTHHWHLTLSCRPRTGSGVRNNTRFVSWPHVVQGD